MGSQARAGHVDVSEVEENVRAWIQRLCIPREELGRMPICPFAKKALLDEHVRIAVNAEQIEFRDFIEQQIAFWKDPMHLFINVETRTDDYTPAILDAMMDELNDRYYREDLFFVMDHPAYPVLINGVDTGNKKYALIVFQSLTKLHEAGVHLRKNTDYYRICPDRVTKEVVEYRDRYVALKREADAKTLGGGPPG